MKEVMMNRRTFLDLLSTSAAGLAVAGTGCQSSGRRPQANPSPAPIAFNTANLVGQVTDYHYELKQWGDQHQKTMAATDERAWAAICAAIAAAGFRAVEVWEAHASPEKLNRSRAATWKAILKDHGLLPIAYAGHLSRETLEVCQWLDIPHIDGGLGSLTLPAATDLCRNFGIGFNFENHPEKGVADILAKIGGGNEWLGVCVDTGWLGTQGVAAPEAIRTLGWWVRHAHIKDVKAVGAHETCLLGEGIVNIAGCLEALQSIDYRGWYSWEDEPENRNPFNSAVRNRQWIEQRLAAAS